jgi:hypothetical protein
MPEDLLADVIQHANATPEHAVAVQVAAETAKEKQRGDRCTYDQDSPKPRVNKVKVCELRKQPRQCGGGLSLAVGENSPGHKLNIKHD